VSRVALADILDVDALSREVATGYVSRKWLAGAPDPGVAVYNYTAKAAGKRHWTHETKLARGLVADGDGILAARPFTKFFDLAQTPAVPEHEPSEVTEKLDGSLGICYLRHDGPAVTTRGSPGSWQGREATELLRRDYGGFLPEHGSTLLVEIIVPENRVVVDYGERRELVAIACIDNATGADLPIPADWPGPSVERYGPLCPGDLGELVAKAEADGNREGFVLRWPGSNLRAKLKLPTYRERHRLAFSTSTLTVWEALAGGRDPVAETADAPEDIRVFVETAAKRLGSEHRARMAVAQQVVDGLDAGQRALRGVAAEILKGSDEAALAFMLLDGRSEAAAQAAWRRVRPPWRPARQEPE